MTAAQEREAVVRWLRDLKDSPGLPAFGFKPHHLQGLYANAFADAIEAGTHIMEKSDGSD